MIDLNHDEGVEELIVTAIEALNRLDGAGRLSEIGRFSDESRTLFQELYDEFNYTGSQSAKRELSSSELKRRKGQALENLASFLLEHSGGLFRIRRNIRTNSNEIDQFCEIANKGKFLLAHGYIDDRFGSFIGECKNYNVKVSVTYVGKFCSLLLTTTNRLGIIFSREGITGTGWRDGSGLVKKFYLSKENVRERFIIIDINKTDFEVISQGGSFLEILHDKMVSLRLDADYQSLISRHPVEEVLSCETTA